MAYSAKDYSNLIGMEGFSDTLLNNHFTLYQGYVTNTNKVLENLDKMLKEGQDGTNPAYAEQQRRFGWEFDGMRLHEFYFENLGGQGGIDPNGKLGKALADAWGSYDAWEKDFKGIGMMRGIGWAALYQDPQTGQLLNCWIQEHDGGHLASCNLVLIMDVFEHAYMVQYGTKKADYIEAFFKNVNWQKAEERLR